MSKPIALCDVDGVLGDFVLGVRRWAAQHLPEHPTEESIVDFDILKNWGITGRYPDLSQWMIDTDYCRHMEVYPGAQAFIEQLRSVAEVVMVTSPMSSVPNWCHARVAWLKEHFGVDKRDVIFTERKELVSGSWLIDDKLENCQAFDLLGDGVALCLDRPWNRASDSVLRVLNYDHALEQIGSTVVAA